MMAMRPMTSHQPAMTRADLLGVSLCVLLVLMLVVLAQILGLHLA